MRVVKVRLQECSLVVEEMSLDTEFDRPPKYAVDIRTQLPDEDEFTDGIVEVLCTYVREEDADAPVWTLSFLVGVEVGADEIAAANSVGIAAIEAVHPYMRQTLRQLGSLAEIPWLSLPARTPGFQVDTPGLNAGKRRQPVSPAAAV